MLAGDAVMGRLVPVAWRPRLITPTRLLLAAPYLLFILTPTVPVAALVVAVASAGFSAGLLLQERLIDLTLTKARGQALGLHSSGMPAMQGVGAVLAGAIAEYLQVGAAMSVMAPSPSWSRSRSRLHYAQRLLLPGLSRVDTT